MAEGQFIIIEGWDVEFVPPTTPLVEEALERGVERDFNGVPTFLFSRRSTLPPSACKWDEPRTMIG